MYADKFIHSPNTRRRRLQKRNKTIKLALLVFVLLIISIISTTLLHHKKTLSTEDALMTNVLAITAQPTNTENPESLNQVVQHELIGTTGDYGVAIVNLKTGENYFYNDRKVFKSASLYKLWVMAVVYEQIQEGNLHENDVLSEDANVLNQIFNIASESAEIKDTKITYTVHDALVKMITISDNYAALLLTEKIRLNTIADFLQEKGFLESHVGTDGSDPTTTSHDMALFLAMLYKGQLANQEYTDKMLTLLKWQKLNNKLPKYLPDNITIAHKTGELDDVTHDAGIVYIPQGEYIIVVMTESDAPDQAEERIANVSQAVYSHFVR